MTDWAIRTLPNPHAFIQWKGTDVCMDCYCICGESFHVDDDFTYAVQCPYCERRYEMSAVIEMREMHADETWNGNDIKIGH
jgi:hypothetical protein